MSEMDRLSQLLARLAGGRPIRRDSSGAWRQLRSPVTDDEVGALAQREFVTVRADRVVLTEVGRVHIERLLDPHSPNRWIEVRGRAGRARITANRNESPLGWLLRRRHISAVQFAAGERLRADFMLAGCAPAVTMRWDPTMVRGTAARQPSEPTAGQLAAKLRFEAACTAAGPGLADILARVVCLGEGLEAAERAFRWPARAGKVVLGIALDRLVVHYGVRRAA